MIRSNPARGWLPAVDDDDPQGRELTDAQIRQQDAVDNACHQLAAEVLGVESGELEWNAERNAALREIVFRAVEGLGITEFQFYPYLGGNLPEVNEDW